ncbi:MAG: enolase-phosphatase E1 [Sclerophora amabilis]|nr:MAG: enolase-phosphatase E1 [Sclerophora amabilis]
MAFPRTGEVLVLCVHPLRVQHGTAVSPYGGSSMEEWIIIVSQTTTVLLPEAAERGLQPGPPSIKAGETVTELHPVYDESLVDALSTEFPHALAALPSILATEWSSPTLTSYISAFEPQHTTSAATFIQHVEDLTASNDKSPALKNLQAYLWQRGFDSGELRAPVYPDVVDALREWTGTSADDDHSNSNNTKEEIQNLGITSEKAQTGRLRIYVYSSGSIAAQKMVFRHVHNVSQHRTAKLPNERDQNPRDKVGDDDDDDNDLDLTNLISDWFDPSLVGPKLKPESYVKIVETAHLKRPKDGDEDEDEDEDGHRDGKATSPGEWLFLSDHIGGMSKQPHHHLHYPKQTKPTYSLPSTELQAAGQAGMTVALVIRPGNPPQPLSPPPPPPPSQQEQEQEQDLDEPEPEPGPEPEAGKGSGSGSGSSSGSSSGSGGDLIILKDGFDELTQLLGRVPPPVQQA